MKERACPKLRGLQEEKIKMIKKEIEAKTSVKATMEYFISLPREEAHSGHPTGHRLESMPRSYTQSFLKRLWIWLKLELLTQQKSSIY